MHELCVGRSKAACARPPRSRCACCAAQGAVLRAQPGAHQVGDEAPRPDRRRRAPAHHAAHAGRREAGRAGAARRRAAVRRAGRPPPRPHRRRAQPARGPPETHSGDVSRDPSSRSSAAARAALALAVALAGCSSIENFVSGDKLDYRSQGSRTPSRPRGAARPDAAGARHALRAHRRRRERLVAPGRGRARRRAVGHHRGADADRRRAHRAPGQPALAGHAAHARAALAAPAGLLEGQRLRCWCSTRPPPGSWRPTGTRTAPSCRRTRSAAPSAACSIRSTPPASATSSAPAWNAPPRGSEVYISHRGVEEVYVNQQKDSTVWQPRRPTRSSKRPSCRA